MEKHRGSISESIHAAISILILVQLDSRLALPRVSDLCGPGPCPLLACGRAAVPPFAGVPCLWGAGKAAAQLPALSSAPRVPLGRDRGHNAAFARDALGLTALRSCMLKEGLVNKATVLHPVFSRSRQTHDKAVDAGTVWSSVLSQNFQRGFCSVSLCYLFLWIRTLKKLLLFSARFIF